MRVSALGRLRLCSTEDDDEDGDDADGDCSSQNGQLQDDLGKLPKLTNDEQPRQDSG